MWQFQLEVEYYTKHYSVTGIETHSQADVIDVDLIRAPFPKQFHLHCGCIHRHTISPVLTWHGRSLGGKGIVSFIACILCTHKKSCHVNYSFHLCFFKYAGILMHWFFFNLKILLNIMLHAACQQSANNRDIIWLGNLRCLVYSWLLYFFERNNSKAVQNFDTWKVTILVPLIVMILGRCLIIVGWAWVSSLPLL